MNPSNKLAASMALSNPFLTGSSSASSPFAPRNPTDVPADAPEGSYTYALVKSAPDVPAAEVETAAPAVEVTIRWGDSVLHVTHLSPPRAFWVGEADGKDGACDFSLPAARLGGATRAPLVLVEGAAVYAVVLPGATGSLTLGADRAERVSLAQAIEAGRAAPCAELAGAYRIALPLDARARVSLGDLSFEIAAVHAGKTIPGAAGVDRRSLPFTALSLALHLGLLGAMAALMPPLALADDSAASDDQRYALAQRIAAIAEREPDAAKELAAGEARAASDKGGASAQPSADPGAAGSPERAARSGRALLSGPRDNPEVHLSRGEWLRQAADFGMVNLLTAAAASNPSVGAPWASLDAAGRDPRTAPGSLWSDALADAGGTGGLDLTGIGEGSDARFVGVNLGGVRTIGDAGFGPAGVPSGRLKRGHQAASPGPRIGVPHVAGRIPPEVIQRIVRQSFGRFRLCYEAGLRSNPSLAGRVSVGFIIGRDGAVSSVQSAGSDVPDPAVVSCVVQAFYGLSFPQPEGGVVKVTYPIMLSPGG